MISVYENRHLITHQPQAGVTEKLEWSSLVSVAYTGAESRKSLRCNPKVTISMTHRVDQSDLTMVQSVINSERDSAGKRIEWWCPLWHLAYAVAAGEFDGTVTISLTDPEEHGFEPSGHCIVYDQRGYTAMLRGYTLSVNTLTLDASVSTITRPFSVAVLREASLLGERELAGYMGDDELSISYRLNRSLKVDSTGVTQFDMIDVLSIPTEETNPDDTDEQETVVGFGTGQDDIIRRREQPVAVSQLRWVGQWGDSDLREDVAVFRRWLWKREGMTVPFLTPTFRRDLILQSVNSTMITLAEALDDFTVEYMKKVSPYVALMWRSNAVASYIKVNVSTMTATTLPITVGMASNGLVYGYGCLVIPTRLRTDEVTFEWTTDRFTSTTIDLQSFYVKEGNVGLGISAC